MAPGKYVVAVSGGVDSMVLLDILRQQPDLDLLVAHFDHGIRDDSAADRQLVHQQAEKYGLPFRFKQGHLGPKASEATARQARYDFLNDVVKANNARAIITAHHEDDLLETAILNLGRGTGRLGLSSLQSRENLVRPLLHLSKSHLQNYARDNQLVWHEDSTNMDLAYRRNFIRHRVMANFTPEQRQRLRKLVVQTRALNHEIDALLAEIIDEHQKDGKLDRRWFIHLPHAIAREVMALWLRQKQLAYDSKTLERLVAGAKTAKRGKRLSINKDVYLHVGQQDLALDHLDR